MSQFDTTWQRFKLQGDMKAREELILKYSYLAKYVVDRMNIRPTGAVGHDDLISYALIGLIEAVERFDPSRDIKFQTYAFTRIRGAVLDALKSLDWIPRSLRETGNSMVKTMAKLESELGRHPSDEETADAMDISVRELNEVVLSMGQSAMLSLEELVVCGQDYSTDSMVGAGNYADADPILAAEIEERKDLLADAIDKLPEREKLVVSLYYKEGLTLKEIAQVLSVTESRACQLHSKAVMRLQGKLARHEDVLLAVA